MFYFLISIGCCCCGCGIWIKVLEPHSLQQFRVIPILIHQQVQNQRTYSKEPGGKVGIPRIVREVKLGIDIIYIVKVFTESKERHS